MDDEKHNENIIEYDKDSVFQMKMCTQKEKNKLNYYNVFLDKDYLVFCPNDMGKIEPLNIKYKYLIRFIEVLIEKTDPKIIHLRAMYKNEIIYFDCHLDDGKSSLIFKERVETARNVIKDKELNILIAYFNEFIK